MNNYGVMVLFCVCGLSYVSPLHISKEHNSPFQTTASSVIFKVKSCGDIHLNVTLLTPKLEFMTYEYMLRGGSDGHSGFIRYRKKIQKEGRSAPRKDCEYLQPYWASWAEGYLSTGSGCTMGQDVLIEYRTEHTELYLIEIFAVFQWSPGALFIFDDQNAAFLKRTPRSLYKGRTSSVVVTTRSKLSCAVACREEPRCAAISYTRDTHQCQLVGPFKTDIQVASVELLLVTQRY